MPLSFARIVATAGHLADRTDLLQIRAMTKAVPLAPQRIDRILAFLASLLLVAVIVALAKGHADWPKIPTLIWLHIATIFVALALTPVMLLRRRGDSLHRTLGWIWVAGLAGTALLSFGIRVIWPGSLSYIHILSVWTLIQIPIIVMSARRHDHARHRRAIHGMVIGALLIAGFFTFPFGRLMGHWLFS